MKKIIFILLTFFIFIHGSKALSKFYLGERIPNMHIETISNTEIHNGVPFILRRGDGQFVYCLEQQLKINTTDFYNEYYHNDKIFKLTEEQLNKINLIAYYGFNYKNHIDIKWYGVTQFVIWKQLNYKDIYFTDTAYGNRIVAYEEEIKEIERLVNDYYKLPSFSNQYLEYTINNNYNIVDLNNVLNNYEIKQTNIEAKIENNNLYINTKEEGIFEITFVRKSPINRNTILYYFYGSQPLIYPGKINDIEFKINIEVDNGSITVNKLDSEFIDRKTAVLKGAVYGIYDEEELITTIETDESGIAYIENLPLGKYYVKELMPSLGYKLDENIYQINLTKDNQDVVIESYEQVIKGNLIINKYYGEEDNSNIEDGAIFEIYDIKDNLIGTYETQNGVINEKLEYGEYYAIQTKGILGYDFVDKFNISIKEEKDYFFELYDEKQKNYFFELYDKEEILIVEVPDTKVKNYNYFISIIFVIFGLTLILKSLKNYSF